MRTITLANSKIECSRLAYGCWRLAGSEGAVRDTPEQRALARQAIANAFEAGYTLFDHADIYGNGLCEAIFGEALQEISGMRERILIASKCGIRRPGDDTPASPYRYDLSASHIVRACEASLRRLRVEALDLYILHRPDYLLDPSEVAQAFAQLLQEGKVRHFGVSNFSTSKLTALRTACPMPLLTHQIEISLAHLAPLDDGTLDQCLTEHLVPLAWSPLAGGRLVATPENSLELAETSVSVTLWRIARSHEVSPALVALAWLLKHPAGIIPIIGSTQPERIRDLVQATGLELSRDEWYRLLEAALGARLP